MKFKRFKKADDLDVFGLLYHSVGLLDVAASIAIEKGDSKTLLKIYDRMLDASDRVMSVVLNVDEEEDSKNNDRAKAGFGFVNEPSAAKGTGVFEEDSESSGLQ